MVTIKASVLLNIALSISARHEWPKTCALPQAVILPAAHPARSYPPAVR
jgi:hypothetical protein